MGLPSKASAACLIGLRDPAIDGFQRFGKRLMDIALAGPAAALPCMLAVAR